MNTKITMSFDDFPASYCAANNASVREQSQFSKLTLSNIALMIIAAVVGSIILSNASGKVILAIISAILLALGICFTLFIRTTKLEQNWYDGRAIAESIKTLSWRYITGSDPYSISLGPAADDRFLKDLKTTLEERKNYAAKLCGHYETGQMITEQMSIIRGLETEKRKTLYLSERINEQRLWYNNKAKINLKLANRYFYGTFLSQALAMIAAISMVFWQNSPVQFTGILTTIATAFIASTQMRRNNELAQSYGLAAQELSFIFEQSRQICTEEQLSSYVNNAEMAISREHTMWVARRS